MTVLWVFCWTEHNSGSCSLQDNRPPGWCLSETYIKFGMSAREDNVWIPDDTYYCKLIGRLVDNIL